MNKVKASIMLAFIIAACLGIPLAAMMAPEEPGLPTRIELSRTNTLKVVGIMNVGQGTELGDVQRQLEGQLAANPEQHQIDIYIDSPGGAYTPETEVFFSYMDYLVKTQKLEIRCVVGTMSASLATVLLSHCTQRYALPRSQIMFHGARIGGFMRMNQFEARGIAEGLAELDARLWGPMQNLIDDPEYWDANFLAERMIPSTELALRYPDVITIIESVELLP